MTSTRLIQQALTIGTQGKGTYEITTELETFVRNHQLTSGTLTIFIQHTSASLIITENADPSARRDLEEFFERLAPEDTPWFTHTHEGPDDMPSHIRAALTHTSETIPIINGSLALGTWQGVFIFEHRARPHQRSLQLTAIGQ